MNFDVYTGITYSTVNTGDDTATCMSLTILVTDMTIKAVGT
jgi:hypothetical protein